MYNKKEIYQPLPSLKMCLLQFSPSFYKGREDIKLTLCRFRAKLNEAIGLLDY